MQIVGDQVNKLLKLFFISTYLLCGCYELIKPLGFNLEKLDNLTIYNNFTKLFFLENRFNMFALGDVARNATVELHTENLDGKKLNYHLLPYHSSKISLPEILTSNPSSKIFELMLTLSDEEHIGLLKSYATSLKQQFEQKNPNEKIGLIMITFILEENDGQVFYLKRGPWKWDG